MKTTKIITTCDMCGESISPESCVRYNVSGPYELKIDVCGKCDEKLFSFLQQEDILDSADNIIHKVLERYQHKQGATKTGRARGFLIVDENVAFLEKPLEEANFHVDTPDKGLEDTKIKKRLLGKRIIVTKNTKDFLDDAPVYDYGIIGLDALPFIGISPTYNETAKLIAKAYGDFDLHSERTGFVLMLRSDGKHVFRRLG